jgi:hypothetical protein
MHLPISQATLKKVKLLKVIEYIEESMASWIAEGARKLKDAKGERHVCSICNATFSDKNELEIHIGKEHQGKRT